MPLTAGTQVGRYRLLALLGRGGMASSWLAVAEDGQRVVLKFPDSAQLGDVAVFERFQRELEIGARLTHPAVPKALAIENDFRHPYLVMEYVEGVLLADVLRRDGPLPWPRAADLMHQLLTALAYLHGQGVYHRDLKPENLMLTPDGRVKIIDFGIALMGGRPRVTWRGFSGLAGTPQYMAPEQIRGERGGAASDIYAAGAILYELLTGRPPFDGDNPLAVMYQALNEALTPVSQLRRVSAGVDAVLARALHRDKAQRFATALDFAEALQDPEAVTPPPQARAAVRRPARRLSPLWREPLFWLLLLAVLTAVGTLYAISRFAHPA